MTKTCFKCGVERPLDDFYRHPGMADGHVNKCKECAKQDTSKNYRARIDHYLAYERNRNQEADRKAARAVYARLRPEAKRRAAMVAGNAIKRGGLKRCPCEVCGTTVRVQAHHDDYSKPLDVRWLCFAHHREHHGQTARS